MRSWWVRREKKTTTLVALVSPLVLGQVELIAIEFREVGPLDDLDQEAHQPIVGAQTKKWQMSIVKGRGEVSGTAQVLIELTQEGECFMNWMMPFGSSFSPAFRYRK
jgi:hypothetical protein